MEQRERLVKLLAGQGRLALAERISVQSCSWDRQRSQFSLLLKDVQGTATRRITAERLLLVPGRFGPTWLIDCDSLSGNVVRSLGRGQFGLRWQLRPEQRRQLTAHLFTTGGYVRATTRFAVSTAWKLLVASLLPRRLTVR